MKKSTNESPVAASVEKDSETSAPKTKSRSLLWEMLSMEGGMSVLILFPLVVLYFLKMTLK